MSGTSQRDSFLDHSRQKYIIVWGISILTLCPRKIREILDTVAHCALHCDSAESQYYATQISKLILTVGTKQYHAVTCDRADIDSHRMIDCSQTSFITQLSSASCATNLKMNRGWKIQVAISVSEYSPQAGGPNEDSTCPEALHFKFSDSNSLFHFASLIARDHLTHGNLT